MIVCIVLIVVIFLGLINHNMDLKNSQRAFITFSWVGLSQVGLLDSVSVSQRNSDDGSSHLEHPVIKNTSFWLLRVTDVGTEFTVVKVELVV
jgi:hypothetical protein